MTKQQIYLREAAKSLGYTQKNFAIRMGAPWPTFEKWLLPPEAGSAREMPAVAWKLVEEIIEHEALKAKYEKLKLSIKKSNTPK